MQTLTQSATRDLSSDDVCLQRGSSEAITASTHEELEQHPYRSCDSRPLTPPPIEKLLRYKLEQGFKDDAVALRQRYHLEEVLAVGGSSIVYKARDTRLDVCPSRKSVAIKILRPELRGNVNATERLKQEFRNAAAVGHPNFIRVFDLEQVSGTWFIAMELLEGQTLAALLFHSYPTPLSVTRAFAILKACAAALTLAHQRGIMHCDFNPSNVWLTATQEVRIMDLGAAQRCAALPSHDVGNESNSGERPPLRGTAAAYASPQILAGKHPELSDDVFSFACVAYELLAGRPPFGRWTAAEKSAQRAALARPSGISLRTWRALKRGLHWQRTQRTPSVHAMLLELENFPAHVVTSRRIRLVAAIAQSAMYTRDWFMSRRVALKAALDALPRVRFSGLLLAARFRWHWREPSIDELEHQRAHRIARKPWRRIVVNRIRLELIRIVIDKCNAISQAPQHVSARVRQLQCAMVAALSGAVHKTTQQVVSHSPLGWLRSFDAGAVLSRIGGGKRLAIGLWRATQQRALLMIRHFDHLVFEMRHVAVGAAAIVIAALVFLYRGPESRAVYIETAPKIASQDSQRAKDLSKVSIFAVPADNVSVRSPRIGFNATPSFDESLASTPYLLYPQLPITWELFAQAFEPATQESMGFGGLPAQRLSFSSRRTASVPAKSNASITLELERIDVSEQAIAAVLLIKREGSKRDPVNVGWRTIVGSAKPGTDYQSIVSGVARFADNQSIRALYVPLKLNSDAQGSRSFVVELSRTSSGASLGKIRRTLVIIQKSN